MKLKEKIIVMDSHYRLKIIRILLFFLFIYALGSVFVSSPFMVRAYSHSPINYSNIMYAHGLTVGLASIISLIVCGLFEMDEKIRGYILLLSVFGVLIGILAGAFNRSVTPPYWLWFQVLSFFCLDGIYLLLIIGFVFNKKVKGTINYWTGLICSVILLFAGITGDIAGWIMDFGNNPPLIGIWANFMGYETVGDFMGRLIFTHSHLMVVSLLSLLTVIFSRKFGREISGSLLVLRITGESLVLLGTLGMALLYTLAGYGRPEMKSMLTDAKVYLHGLAFTELCVGIGVLYGGLIILLSVLIHKKKGKIIKKEETTINSITLTWICMVLFLPGMGYFIKVNAEKYSDVLLQNKFSFYFLHMDLVFFLFPALMVIMLLTLDLINEKKGKLINLLLRAGTIVTYVGAMIYVIIEPSLYGAGFWVISFGFFVISLAMLLFIFPFGLRGNASDLR